MNSYVPLGEEGQGRLWSCRKFGVRNVLQLNLENQQLYT
jgi:hypothetical protein